MKKTLYTLQLVKLRGQEVTSNVMSGGGADQLLARVERERNPMEGAIEPPIGRAIRAGADEAYLRPVRWSVSHAATPPLLRGEGVRNWSAEPDWSMTFPYSGFSV